MPDSIQLTTTLPAAPQRVYRAWLSGEEHAAMTGGDAACEPMVGGRFTAWDGYIQGTNLELTPYARILQSWRSSEFPDDAPDSRLEVLLEEDDGGRATRLTLIHSAIPDGQGESYRQGWVDNYFDPMREYFGS